MARRSTIKLFGASVEVSLTWCAPEDLEYNNYKFWLNSVLKTVPEIGIYFVPRPGKAG